MLILLERQQDLTRVLEKQLEQQIQQRETLLLELDQSQRYREQKLLPALEPSSTLELDRFLELGP